MAEELMRRIEKEEENELEMHPNKQILHLCIVNLVIGTLYCAKGNYEFGVSRIIKSLEPVDKKLSIDTWFYAKRCFVALFEILAKHMILLKDTSMDEILKFLDACDKYGANMTANVENFQPSAFQANADNLGTPAKWMPINKSKHDDGYRNTITFEARHLKQLYLRLYD